MKQHLSLATFHEWIVYDEGILRWKKFRHPSSRPGDPVGCLNPDGYRFFKLFGVNLNVSHAIWFMTTGAWPVMHLDHINGRRDDNRIENLRECTIAQNCANRRPKGMLGVKGVHKTKSGRFVARAAGRSLGSFHSISEAAQAYDEAAKAAYGEFAFLNNRSAQ